MSDANLCTRCGHAEESHGDWNWPVKCLVVYCDCRVSGADIRGAFTPAAEPETKCGVCMTCDPPGQWSRMYVCGTCGNKRCPAASDCQRWECSGSNATNQVPVPRRGSATEPVSLNKGHSDTATEQAETEAWEAWYADEWDTCKEQDDHKHSEMRRTTKAAFKAGSAWAAGYTHRADNDA